MRENSVSQRSLVFLIILLFLVSFVLVIAYNVIGSSFDDTGTTSRQVLGSGDWEAD